MDYAHVALLLFFSVGALSAPQPPNRVLAKLNGKPIYEADLKAVPGAKNKAEALDRLILFHLATSEAKKLKLDQDPSVAQELNRVLYRSYLSQASKNLKTQTEPSETELAHYYYRNPLIRVHHLVLNARTPQQKKVAENRVLMIEKALKKGVSFQSLILKYSEDEDARFGGDLDYRGKHTLSPEFYKASLLVKKGAVTPALFSQGAYHFFQWVDLKSYSEIPATYKEYMRSELKTEKEHSLLATALNDLKKSAKIEIVKDE